MRRRISPPSPIRCRVCAGICVCDEESVRARRLDASDDGVLRLSGSLDVCKGVSVHSVERCAFARPETGGMRCRWGTRCGPWRFYPWRLLDSLDGPCRVLRDQWFGVQRRFSQRRQITRGPDVAKGDADIAQKAPALDPLDRRPRNSARNCRRRARGNRATPICDRWAGSECRLAGGLSEAVPRARLRQSSQP